MRISSLIIGVTLAWAVAVLPASAWAQESGLFVIRGLKIDRTAESATKAREEAIAEGQIDAFRRLYERLVPSFELGRMPNLTADQIQSYVLDYSVENEKTSSVRYLADFSVRFQAEEIRSLLQSSGINFAITQSKPVLVLPLYGNENHVRLWQEPNYWLRAWSHRFSEDRLVPLVVPLGDLSDLSAIDADAVMRGDLDRIRQMAYRYGAEDTLITQALISGNLGDGTARLQVVSRRIDAYQQAMQLTLKQGNGESLDALLARAAEAVDAQVQEKWKLANLLDFSDRRFMAVSVETLQLGDWLAIRQRLADIVTVESVQVTRLSRGWTEIDLAFVGDEERLTVAMAQRDLLLTPRYDGRWELRLDPTVARPAAGARGKDGSASTESGLNSQ